VAVELPAAVTVAALHHCNYPSRKVFAYRVRAGVQYCSRASTDSLHPPTIPGPVKKPWKSGSEFLAQPPLKTEERMNRKTDKQRKFLGNSLFNFHPSTSSVFLLLGSSVLRFYSITNYSLQRWVPYRWFIFSL